MASWSFQDIERIFHDALEVAPEERGFFLEERFPLELRTEVQKLLDADAAAGGPVDGETEPAISSRRERGILKAKDQLGPYEIRSVIGSGGMGVVYEAWQESPRRIVALKVLSQELTSTSALRRFQHETRVLGRLRHPGIAQIYEAGVHRAPEGELPYFAMEYLAGAKGLLEHVRERDLGIPERLKLFAAICRAVHHGHQRGIIHRDLKPANLLVDSSGDPKVIDFGVARSTDADLTVTTLQTHIGQLVGTLQYMSPEQCDADPHELDIRSDVYSLGVVLYELLSGKLPYDVSSTTIYQATRTIRETEPPRLSTVDPSLGRDLETIVGKALEKDRTRRYDSAADLGRDVERHLNGEPILARPPTLGDFLRTLYGRYRPLLVAVLVTFVVTVGMMVTFYWSLVRTESELETKTSELGTTKTELGTTKSELGTTKAELAKLGLGPANLARQRATLQNALSLVSSNSAQTLKQLALVDEPALDWEKTHVGVRADLSLGTVGFPGTARIDILQIPGQDDILVATTSQQDKTLAIHRMSLNDHGQVFPVRRASIDLEDSPDVVTIAPDATKVAVVIEKPPGGDGVRPPPTLQIRSVGVGPSIGPPSGESTCGTATGYPAFSPDGSMVATSGYVLDDRGERIYGAVEIRDGTSASLLVGWRAHNAYATGLVFSPDGRLLATVSEDKTARLWDVQATLAQGKGVCVAVFRGHGYYVHDMAFRPDGLELATASLDGLVRLWDVEASMDEFRDLEERSRGSLKGQLGREGRNEGIRSVAYGPEGRVLAFGGITTTVELVEVDPHSPHWEPDSATGHYVLGRSPVRRAVASLRGHEGFVERLWFHRTGIVISAGRQERGRHHTDMKSWPAWRVRDVPQLVGHLTSVVDVEFLEDDRLVSLDGNGRVVVWRSRSMNWESATGTSRGAGPTDLEVSSSGLLAVSRKGYPDRPGGVAIVDASTAGQLAFRGLLTLDSDGATKVALTLDGDRLVAGLRSGSIAVWTRAPGTSGFAPEDWGTPVIFPGHPTPVGGLALVDQGRTLVTAGGLVAPSRDQGESHLRVWRFPSMEPIDEQVLPAPASAMRASRDQRHLVLGLESGEIWTWRYLSTRDPSNPALGAPSWSAAAHTTPVRGLAFHPTENRLASCGGDRAIRLWDLGIGLPNLTLQQLGAVNAVAFRADGKTLASASSGYQGIDNVVRLWETDVTPDMRLSRARLALDRHRVHRILWGPINISLPAESFAQALAILPQKLDRLGIRLMSLYGSKSPVDHLRRLADAEGLPAQAYQRGLNWIDELSELEPETALGPIQKKLQARLH